MTRLKQLIIHIHHRSLWQVLLIYLGASWAVLEAVDHVVERYFLPEWVSAAAVILLLIGLPIVMATAFVREEPWRARAETTSERGSSQGESGVEPDSGEARSASPPTAGAPSPGPLARFLTWPRAILGGALAFLVLGLISAFIVVKGLPRVAEARGEAGDAFGERAWIVVADFDVGPEDRDIAEAARTALTIDLQQSRYVNVYSREQVIPVLARMGLPDTTKLDRRLALEIAEREGLAAVLAPEVSRLGSDYVFGARVFESGSRRELIAVRTAARENRLLEGVEALSREVRGRLGEASEQIGRSKPLPEVTTRSLEALKKYARAMEALTVRDDWREAIAFGTEAVQLDSSFAMAERLLGAAHFNAGQRGEAREHATRAYDLRERLTDRERLHVEAFHAFLTDEPRRAAETWDRILSRYPDDSRAANNLGTVSLLQLGDYERAYRSYRRALELSPYNAIAHGNAIYAAIAAGRLESADSVLTVVHERGHSLAAGRGELALAIAREDLARADAVCDSLLSVTDGSTLAEHRMVCGSMDVARGRPGRATERLEGATRYYAEEGLYFLMQLSLAGLLHAEESRARADAAGVRLRNVLARFPADSLPEPDRHDMRTRLIVHSALLGRGDLIDAVAAAYPAQAATSNWRVEYGQAVAGAARALAEGETRRALDELRTGLDTGYEPLIWVSEIALIRGLAFEGVGERDSAVAHLEAAITPWIGMNWQVTSRVVWPFVLRRLAELEESRGNTEAALRHYRRWLELRSDPDPSLRGEVAAVRRAVARLAGAETS